MKRFLSLILALTLMLSMAACGGNGDAPVEKVKTNVADPLSWDDIEAIPIANDSMTEDELRQICVDFMRLQLTFGWTPSHDVTYNNGRRDKTFTAGTVYGGIPYVNGYVGNIYTATRYVDPDNGMIDTSEGSGVFNMFANQCSGSTFWGWARVSNTIKYGGTGDCTEAFGCLRVGDYTYDSSITDFPSFYVLTTNICKTNGTNVMYESYAKMKPADGLVYYTTAGHVMMVSKAPNVVRNADGTINGEKSTVTFMDQKMSWNKQMQPDGTTYEIEGGLDTVTTFAQLFSWGSIPFTLAEFNKTNPVEKGEVSIDYTGSSITVDQLDNCTVTSNYAISDVTISVKNSKGKELYSTTSNVYSGGLNKCYKPVALSLIVNNEDLATYAKRNNIVEVSLRIGTGEKLVAYSGKLTK